MSIFRHRVAVWPNMSHKLDCGRPSRAFGMAFKRAVDFVGPGLTGLAAAVLLSCGACAGPGSGSSTAPEPVRPAYVLDQFDLSVAMSPDQARSAQEAVSAARETLEDALTREEIACYGKFIVRRCLDQLGERRRAVNERLNDVEVAANQRLRDEAALTTSRRLADEAARRLSSREAEAQREALNRQEYEARLDAARQAQARRDAEAPEIARRTEALRLESERKEQALARRREEAQRRQAAESGNVAARARAIEANRQQQIERQARQAQQEARKQRESGATP